MIGVAVCMSVCPYVRMSVCLSVACLDLSRERKGQNWQDMIIIHGVSQLCHCHSLWFNPGEVTQCSIKVIVSPVFTTRVDGPSGNRALVHEIAL